MFYFIVHPHLPTIVEESESRASSQTSFFKDRRKKEAFSISNKDALEDKSPTAETNLDELLEPGERAMSFSNKTALEREEDEEHSESDSSGEEEQEKIRRVVMARNINRNGDRAKNAKPYDSPLLHYSPRASAIPPEEVKGWLTI